MGTQWLEPAAYQGAKQMRLKNISEQIAFMDLKVPGSLERATTVVLLPGEVIMFPLKGNGALGTISSGTLWCNRRAGWQDARFFHIRQAIMARPDTTVIKGLIYDRGGGQLGLKHFFESATKQAPQHFN